MAHIIWLILKWNLLYKNDYLKIKIFALKIWTWLNVFVLTDHYIHTETSIFTLLSRDCKSFCLSKKWRKLIDRSDISSGTFQPFFDGTYDIYRIFYESYLILPIIYENSPRESMILDIFFNLKFLCISYYCFYQFVFC